MNFVKNFSCVLSLMDIILDTNIFREDFLFHKTDLRVLHDYLKKTGSNIVVPQIILEETLGLYVRTLVERLTKLKNANNNVLLTLVNPLNDQFFIPKIDPESEAITYLKYLEKKLGFNEDDIIPYEESYLTEIVNRAINRKKPCGSEGQGFRDTIVWLTIVDYCRNIIENQIVFISSNIKDFGSNDNRLAPELQIECKEKGIKVNYYTSIEGFVADHAFKIDFITQEWLDDILISENLSELVIKKLNTEEHSGIVSWFQHKTGNDSTGYWNVIDLWLWINDYYAYEMLDNSYIITLICEFDAETEFEYYELNSSNFYGNDFYDYNFKKRVSYNTMHFSTYAVISFKLIATVVTDVIISKIGDVNS